VAVEINQFVHTLGLDLHFVQESLGVFIASLLLVRRLSIGLLARSFV